MSAGAVLAKALREAFDARFAEPRAEGPGERVRLLVVTLGGEPAALRLSELAGVSRNGKLVRLPGGAPGFLGLAGVRGRVVPVFDLAALAGRGAGRHPSWVALANAPAPVGLSFEAVDTYLEVPPGEVCSAAGPRRLPHARQIVRRGGALVPVLDVPSVLAALAAEAGGALP